MPLHPQAASLLELIAAIGDPPVDRGTPEDARAARRARQRPPTIDVHHIEDLDAGGVPARFYRPSDAPDLGLLVYFHGGGWVIGDLDSHDNVCRALADGSGHAVLSIDYRLAPEHRFPAAVDDAFAATRWIAANAAKLGGDPARLVVMGDSAGGNLAAVVALLAREERGPALSQQVLIYPATHHDFARPSVKTYGEGFLLTHIGMKWFWDHYLGPSGNGKDWRASPILAKSLAGLPPAFVLTAEYDVLRDEGEEYAAKLKQAGVPTQLVRYDSVIHGFITFSAVNRTLEIVSEVAAAIRQRVGTQAFAA